MTTQRKFAAKLLDTLVELDVASNSAYYEMGRILHVFRADKLYEVLEYSSFVEMVECELSYSKGTAQAYARFYARTQELKYTKAEVLNLLSDHGLTNLSKVMRGLSTKLGTRAIKTRIEALDQHHINFTLTTAQLEEAHVALEAMGATMSDEGRYLNSSEAFMGLVHKVVKVSKAA